MIASVKQMPREQFVQQQNVVLDDTFALTSGEEAIRACFEGMAIETYDHLIAARASVVMPFSVVAYERSGPVNFSKATQGLLPCDLLKRWHAWSATYAALSERNPRLGLRDAMTCIGETHRQCSWPSGLEPVISDWIDGGRREPLPFDDRYALITPEFYERLRSLRVRAGGFVVSRPRAKGYTFLAETEWQREKIALQRKAHDAQSFSESNQARSVYLQRRMAEIIAEARNDVEFWGALRSSEAEREARRPIPDQRHPSATLKGPIGMVKLGSLSAGLAELDDKTLDPTLTACVERVLQPLDLENGLSATLIVAVLRGLIRNELGFDGRLR